MKIHSLRLPSLLLAALLGAAGTLAVAASTAPPPSDAPASATGTEADAAPPPTAAPGAPDAANAPNADWDSHEDHDDAAGQDQAAGHDSEDHGRHAARKRRHAGGRQDNQIVNVGADSVLEAGKQADSVVAVFGNARDAGTVSDDVVSVFGSTYVDGRVGGDAVSVFGNLELGPHAEIGGDAVTVFGKLLRDPAALVHGESRSVFGHDFSAPNGLRSWIDHCLFYGRPLSLAADLGWAWGLALSLLALYLCIALVFRDGVERSVETFERHPGPSVLAALLAVLLTPVLIVLLCITVVGIAAVPFVVIGLFCVALFGKAVILAWLGGRVLRLRELGSSAAVVRPHPAAAVLFGGLIALALYLIPFFGFVVYKLLGFLGFGAVIYTAILGLRARQAAKNGGAHAAATPDTTAAAATAATAGTAATAAEAALGGPSRADEAAGAAAPLSAVLAAQLPRAGFWIRMAALLLDVLLVGVATHLLLHTSSDAHLVLLAAYGAIMWKLRGSTVGGIVFDLRVVRADGREMDWETAIIRALSCFLSLAVAGLGFFWIAFDPANQAWHDKIAGTVVVRVPKVVAAV
jgi:uncharacterized RDD family membrane protein YckC